MKTLIIGGTGFISSALVRKLLGRKHDVTVLTRGVSASAVSIQPGVRYIQADRHHEQKLREAVAGKIFDAVYDMVAYGPEESRSAVRIFKGRTGRFVHCSTISVYMLSANLRCPITEDQDRASLMTPDHRSPFGWDYGVNKRRCEEVLWNAHDERSFPVSMIRPTFVSGPRDPAKRDFFWIERILDGGPLLVPGPGEVEFQNVYVEDVATAFADLLDCPVSVGQAYNVADETRFSLNSYLQFLAELLQKEPHIVHVDQERFDALPFSLSSEGDVFPFNTRRNAVFSLEKARRDLGFRSTPVRDWMNETILYFTGRFKGHSNGYGSRRKEIEFSGRLAGT